MSGEPAAIAAPEPLVGPGARLRLFYFLYYAGVGVTLPYFSLYLQGLGLDGRQIGLLQMLQPLLAAPAGLLWAAAADRMRAANRALAISAFAVAAAYATLPLARGAWGVAGVMIALGLAGPALVPLIDGLVVEWTRRQPTESYPRTRLFGSLGYVAAAQGLGLWLWMRGERPADPLVPAALLAASAGLALVSLGLPAAPLAERATSLRAALGLLRNKRLVLLLVMCALHWMGCAPYNVFFGPLAREHGLPDAAIGLASALGVATEVAVLWMSPALEARFSKRALFATSFAITALRWALVGSVSDPRILVALQALHGATFGLFWATVVRALRDEVPHELRATGQALFGAVAFQLASALANPIAGAAFDRAGHAAPLFTGAGVVELFALLLALLS